MDYFGDYFDPTYFDTADGGPVDEPTGGPTGRRRRVAPIAPLIDPDADEAYLGVI